MSPFYTITFDELEKIRKVVKTATMGTANFRKIGPGGDADDSIDELIKERTLLWRSTWIIEPLLELIEKIEEREARVTLNKLTKK